MTAGEFKSKWAKVTAKETSAYVSHFEDLCSVLKVVPPLKADPAGEFFCYQKKVTKDAELFDLSESGGSQRGFADVWKQGCFAWEYKGKRKNLDEAYKQLLRYREALENPPLLVVCDFDRFIIKTNFNGTVQEVHEFTNAEIDQPKAVRLLRALFHEPEFLKPQRTTAQVTEVLAKKIAEIAKSLQKRESRELANARTRAQMNFSQRKNLRIARFLNRVVFCFFAEDTGLLPKHLFSDIAKTGLDDPKHFAETLETLFSVMAKGGSFGLHKIRHFNGHLFEESTVFELTEAELRDLADASEADWQFIEPSIMGTLFERALEPAQRSQLGAHYTSEADIKTLVEPVLMAPLRLKWGALKGELAAAYVKGKGTTAQRDKLAAMQEKLAAVTVLDPACGSGNFLYVSLQLLLGLEKEVVTYATQLGFKLTPQVSVQQLRAIELNPYAFELAQVSVQIGLLQWRRDNGFDNDRSPVLQDLDGFENKDALMRDVFKTVPKDLEEAQAAEHVTVVPMGESQVEIGGISDQGELTEAMGASPKPGFQRVKVYYERSWPECDMIVGNPPFLGASRQWDELGREYCEALQRLYGGRVSGAADLCCYWFEKARKLIAEGKCKRAGLLATQAIRCGASREVLKRVKESGGIFFAESDRDWILAGANVHVSMIGFDDGTDATRSLDGKPVTVIHSNLTAATDVTAAIPLAENQRIAFSGTKKSGDFDIADNLALEWLALPNPHGKPNSDLLKPWLNGSAIVKRMPPVWIIDTGTDLNVEEFALYERLHAHALQHVKPQREENKREHRRLKWWLHAETCPGMRAGVKGHQRFLSTPRVSKFRIFSWADSIVLPDDGIYIFTRSDDYFFGIVHSRFHEVWALKLGSRLEDRPRYTPITCFETFAFPRATPTQEASVAAAAKNLNAMRERWLNPPEWTQTQTLTFPGSTAGPWASYIDGQTADPQTDIGTVRYPRLQPFDVECAAKLKKRTLTNLYNERPTWLGLAHEKLDAAVAAAYGWPPDLTNEQILEKLLGLNLERAGEEARRKGKKISKNQRSKADGELL